MYPRADYYWLITLYLHGRRFHFTGQVNAKGVPTFSVRQAEKMEFDSEWEAQIAKIALGDAPEYEVEEEKRKR